jgi:ribosomal protein S18 acetylase RimI-like enzyme
MPKLQRIGELPPNFEEYIEEISLGIGAIYGTRAAQEYCRTARSGVEGSLAHPMVDAFAIWEKGKAAGLLFTALRGNVGHISFIHVLRGYTGRGFEARLVREAVRTLRAGGVAGIVAECIPFGPLDLDAVYRQLRFNRVERLLMTAPVEAAGLVCTRPLRTGQLRDVQWPAVAQLIVNTYRDHVDRALHAEVRDEAGALAFLESVTTGGYGNWRGEFGRVIVCKGEYVGAVLGCLLSQDVGFLLQVVVRPELQGRGFGTQLVRELALMFREAGSERMALGVTAANPAVRLYARLGFGPRLNVNAYAWWRPGCRRPV